MYGLRLPRPRRRAPVVSQRVKRKRLAPSKHKVRWEGGEDLSPEAWSYLSSKQRQIYVSLKLPYARTSLIKIVVPR